MKRFVLFATFVMVPLACSTKTIPTGTTAKNPTTNTEPGDKGVPGTGKQGDDKKDGEWVLLFNGTDLDGWEPLPAGKSNWKVDSNGWLVGNSATQGYLVTKRGDFENFHLRFEAKVADKADSGVFFRVKNNFKMTPVGMEAQINSNAVSKQGLTGSLSVPGGGGGGAKGGGKTGKGGKADTVTEELVPPGTWYRHEIIADGKRIQVLVNDKPTADYKLTTDTYVKGHLAIQAKAPTQDFGGGAKKGGKATDAGKKGKKGGGVAPGPGGKEVDTIYIRKLEIKELPPSGGKL